MILGHSYEFRPLFRIRFHSPESSSTALDHTSFAVIRLQKTGLLSS